MKAYLSEIFSSIQGEGPFVGERQLFIRFCDCHRSCAFCDTNFSRKSTFLLEEKAGSARFSQEPNPISLEQLLQWVDRLDTDCFHPHIALTGGEPLLQVDFLEAWLPELLKRRAGVYLETTGDLPNELERVVKWIDVVSMDIKLPSVTGESSSFSKHQAFLEILQQYQLASFVKIVVSAKTDLEELLEAGKLLNKTPSQTLILQPVTPLKASLESPSGKQLLTWQKDLMAMGLTSVRVIPQTHRMMEVL